MTDIKILAINAARQYATDTEDLISQAAKIEAYLTGGAPDKLTDQKRESADPAHFRKNLEEKLIQLPNGDPLIEQIIKEELGINMSETFSYETPEIVTEMTEDAKNLSREYDEVDDLVKLAKALTSNLEDLRYQGIDPLKMNAYELEEWKRGEIKRKYHERMKKSAVLLENCGDLLTAPVVENSNYSESRQVSNFRIDEVVRYGGIVEKCVPLTDLQLTVAQYMKEGNLILNVHRHFGTTTLIAAFARQEAALGKKVLVLTNNYSSSKHISLLIDDGAVKVYTFDKVANLSHNGEFYHHVLIDMASFIPYALEERIKQYIGKCNHAFLKNQNIYRAPGYPPELPLITIAGVPGMEQGWFYEAFTNNLDMRRVTIPWTMSNLSPNCIKNLEPEVSANQYENKFRPVKLVS